MTPLILNCSDVLNQQAINFNVPNEEGQNFDSETDGIGCEPKEEIGFSSNFLLNQKYDKLGYEVIQNITIVILLYMLYLLSVLFT